MRKLNNAILLTCSFFLLQVMNGASAQSVRSQHSDTQQWNEVQLNLPISKKVDLLVLGTLRVGGNIRHPVDERIGAAFSFKVGKYLSLAPSYLHLRTQPIRGVSSYENRLSLPATVRFPIGKFTVSDRNLIEGRFRNLGRKSLRYRNKLQIDHPLIAEKKLNWFVSDEVFYDWAVDDWVRNRFSLGVSKAVNKHLTFDVYYMRQNDGRSLPGNLNIVGTLWRIRR